jgi:tetratricopeptide (TPR) repeat protein
VLSKAVALVARAVSPCRSASAAVLTAVLVGLSPTAHAGAQEVAGAARAQESAGTARAARSVAAVVTRDTNGNRLSTGAGVFVGIGRLAVPRALLLSGASVAVIVRGRENRVTAVLADDAASGLALVAVDLPEGAPDALTPPPTRTPVAGGRYRAVLPDGAAVTIELQGEQDVPGLGALAAATLAGAAPNGSAVVGERGDLVGMLIERVAGDARLLAVVPVGRLAVMPAVGPLPVGAWRQRVAAGPAEGDAAYLRGVDAALRGRTDEASANLRQAASQPGGGAAASAALGSAEANAGHQDAALVAFRAAVKGAPENARYHHELAVVLFDRGLFADAAVEFGEVARLRPGDAEAQFNLGTAYGKLERYEDEYTAYQAALRENSAHVNALRNLGIACIALKRYAEAVAVSARAVRFLPFDAALRAQLGVAYYDMGNYPSAIEELKRAVTLDPGFVRGHYGLAVAYAAGGQHAEALQECEALKALDPARGAELQKLVAPR